MDVNALVALGLLDHEFHEPVATWVRGVGTSGADQLSTSNSVDPLKRSQRVHFGFVADDHDVSHWPSCAKSAKQTTDGHLARLAIANDAVLATLDERIPGAFVIPF